MIRIEDGRGSEASFSERGDLVALRSNSQDWSLADPAPGWSLRFVCDGGKDPDDNKLLAYPTGDSGAVWRRGSDRLDVSWAGVALADGPAVQVAVTVRWWLADGLLHGQLALEALEPPMLLDAVVMPDVTFEHGEDTTLFAGEEMGICIKDAAACLRPGGPAPRPMTFTYPGRAHMQCFGWLDGQRGLYFDCRDRDGWIKRWVLSAEGPERFRLRVIHPTPRVLDPPGTFRQPYPSTLGGFRGGWYDVGTIYRRWAMTTPWASRGPQARRGSFLGEIACWVWNRGPIESVCPPTKALADRLGLPVGLHWYWWHKHAYDTEYPDYFPPREGQEAFAAAVADLQSNGVFVQIYTNGMAFDADGAAWEPDGPPCAVVREDGEYLAPVYNAFVRHRLANACGDSEPWRQIVLDVARRAEALGIDGLYLDMIATAGGRSPCYSPHHAHAPGGGCYGVQGFRRTLRRLRQVLPGLPLSSESTSECYADLFDAYITPGNSQERLKFYFDTHGGAAWPIPLYSVVYHGLAVCFGNCALLDGVPPFDELWPHEFKTPAKDEKDWAEICPDQFALELARTVVFGCQPMVANLTMRHLEDEKFAADVKFLEDVCRFYHANRELLLWGRMLPPGELTSAQREVVFLQRWLFTRPGQEALLRRVYPAVLHSAWQAPSGEAAAVLINHSRDPVPVTYRPADGFEPGEFPTGFRRDGGGLKATLPARSVARLPLART